MHTCGGAESVDVVTAERSDALLSRLIPPIVVGVDMPLLAEQRSGLGAAEDTRANCEVGPWLQAWPAPLDR